jgi:glycosyltransferase involved in cell wall biosynthesis
MARPSVLACLASFWPGYDSTGPNISLKAFCEALCDEFDIRILARIPVKLERMPDFDLHAWHDRGFAKVRYLKGGRVGAAGLRRVLSETPGEVIMLNSFFDRTFTIPTLAMRRAGLIPRRPVLLAPRGEFSEGALSLKAPQKSYYRKLVHAADLLGDSHLVATSELELADIRKQFPRAEVSLIPNFRGLFPLPHRQPRPADAPLQLVFLGRISRVKGLDFGLQAIAASKRRIRFNIYGLLQDQDYWQHCQALAAAMPDGITVDYHGEVANDQVAGIIARHDAMLLPSLSENFGHAIFEALASGTPVIIGDRTPWRGLVARQAGWDLPVGDQAAFVDALRTLADFGPDERTAWQQGARACAEDHVRNNQAAQQMRTLLRRLALGNTR